MPSGTSLSKQQKAAEIIRRLSAIWPNPQTELVFTKPHELLFAVILSAQATDKLVNTVTPGLFSAFPEVEDYASASEDDIDGYIRKVNFHKTKARNIHACALALTEKFGSKVPATMEQLLTLPGVARKTANVILGDLFNTPEGIVVDTHVKRLSYLLGLTDETDPVKIENDLIRIVPREHWKNFSHLLILFGRYKCPARMNLRDNELLGDLASR